MTKPLVAITHIIPDAGIKNLLKKKYRLKISKKNRPLSKAQLKQFVKGADAILCMLFDHIDASQKKYYIGEMIRNKSIFLEELIEECKKCRILCRACHKIRTSKQIQENYSSISSSSSFKQPFIPICSR